MIFIFFLALTNSKVIIEYPELEKRSADSTCQEYQKNYEWKNKPICYTPGEGCNYGVHNVEDIEWTTKRVNFYRQLVGLSAIQPTTNQTYLNWVNQACLVMEKNNIFSNDLSNRSLECWTEDAEIDARNSNIFLTAGSACSTDSIPLYIDDQYTSSVVHRRCILNPPYSQVAAGVSKNHSALLVFNIQQNASNPVPPFIAYPPPGPVPSDLIPKYWSFSRFYNDTSSDEHNQMPSDTKVVLNCENSQKKISITNHPSESNSFPGAIVFNGDKMKAGSYCKVSISSDSADTEWRYIVRSISCIDGIAYDVSDGVGSWEGGNGGNINKNKKGFNAGVIAGIVIGVVAFVAIFVIIAILIIKKCDFNNQSNTSNNQSNTSNNQSKTSNNKSNPSNNQSKTSNNKSNPSNNQSNHVCRHSKN